MGSIILQTLCCFQGAKKIGHAPGQLIDLSSAEMPPRCPQPSGKLPGSAETCQVIMTGVQRPPYFMHLVIIMYLYQAPEV